MIATPVTAETSANPDKYSQDGADHGMNLNSKNDPSMGKDLRGSS
jgi:hypothetical protein